MKNSNKQQDMIFIIVIAVIVVIGVIGVIYFYSSANDNPYVEKEKEIKTMLQETSDKFTNLSAEMLAEDGVTLKDDYNEAQKNLFNTIIQEIGEMDEYIEDAKKEDSSVSEEDYYNELAEKITNINKQLTALDIDLHTDSAEFTETFAKLSDLFNKIVEKATTEGDNRTLTDDYKEFQSEYDKIYEEILSLGDDADSDNINQEYYDNLTEKGKELLSKLNDFVADAGISLD